MGFLLNLLPFVGSIFTRTKDSADLVERNASAEHLALRSAVAAEAARQPTTWWDSLVDGLNRLVRPLFTFGTLGLFVWACIEPISFSASMTALQLVPENLWIILGTVVVFWFGDRMLGLSAKGGKAPAQVAQVIAQMREIESLQKNTQDAPQPAPAQQVDQTRRETEKPQSGAQTAPEAHAREMADTSKPLSLPAIEEWNRLRQGQ